MHPFIPMLIGAVSVVLAVVAPPVSAAHNISWMYEADVPVLNQSQQARVQAAEAGFRQVLGRLTGQGENGLPIRVSGASADRLMTRFSYHSVVVDGRRQPRVRFSFDPGQTLATVRNAGLPVWGAMRPSVILYLLGQEADGSRIPLAETHPVSQAMAQQAWVRGLVLTFAPFNDTEVPVDAMLDAVNPNRIADPLAETAEGVAAVESTEAIPADVNAETGGGSDAATGWPCVSDSGTRVELETPPEPFLPGIIPRDNELVLVGEFRSLPPAPDVTPGPAFRWASGTDRGVIDLPAGDAVAQGLQVVDQVADVLGRRFGVPWVSPRERTLRVAAVTRIPAYAELMRYLGRQEIFARVDLLEAGPEHFLFRVVTPADEAVLERVFRVEARLRPEPLQAGQPGAGTDPSCDQAGMAPDAAALDITAEDGTVDNGSPVFVWQD